MTVTDMDLLTRSSLFSPREETVELLPADDEGVGPRLKNANI
jgi:hypothetical protein